MSGEGRPPVHEPAEQGRVSPGTPAAAPELPVEPGRSRPSPLLLLVISLVVFEAVAYAAAGIRFGIDVVAGVGDATAYTVFLAIFLLLLTVLLLLAAGALRRRRRWGRGLVITWQVFQLAVAVAGFQSGTTAGQVIGVVLAVVSVTVVVVLLTPTVVRETT